MKASDLRLGNYLIDEDGEIFKVCSIFLNHPLYKDCVFGENNLVSCIYTIKPISLTEEWLLKFGFIKDDNGNYWIDLQTHYLELVSSNEHYYPVYVQVPEMSHEEEQRVSMNRIVYVHQLQNLYFALTGKELEQHG